MQTLGDVITAGLILAALIIVPYKLAKAWLWPQIKQAIMSRWAAVPVSAGAQTERRSDAAEHDRNGMEPTNGTAFRSAIVTLEQCDDDALLDILAQLTGPDGDYRFAESRIAKFIPGRVEDRLAQVRAVRDTALPPPPGRVLRVRDEHGERLIPMDA